MAAVTKFCQRPSLAEYSANPSLGLQAKTQGSSCAFSYPWRTKILNYQNGTGCTSVEQPGASKRRPTSLRFTPPPPPSQGEEVSWVITPAIMIRQQRTRVQAPALPQPGILSASSSTDARMEGGAQTPSEDGVIPMKKTRNPDLPDLRNRLRIATWNVLTMSDSGYQTAHVREIARHHIPITGITEARIL